MARINQGILGPFSGKVGEVIGSSWKGIPYIKSRTMSFHDPKTPAQLAHRMKLQVAHGFVRSVKGFIEIGYRELSENQTPYNKAVSFILRNAVVGEYPAIGIDPSKVMVSQGKLAGAENCLFSMEEDGKLNFSWDENIPNEGTQADDCALLLVYNFTKQQAISAQSCRSERKGTAKIPDNWKGDKMAVYIFFASIESDAVSNSQYLGMV